MKHTINILLSSQETVYRVDAQGLSSRSIESAIKVGFKSLNLPPQQRSEQDDYLKTAAQAAYVSLNELDKAFKYRAAIGLTSNTGVPISFEPQSVSAGLGYSIVLALEWRKQRAKDYRIDTTIFATGHIHPSGNVTAIGHLTTKIEAACKTAHSESLHDFVVYYPKNNDSDISLESRSQVEHLNGRLVPIEKLSDALIDMLGDDYDGLPFGRWEPFKGLERFTYADRFRFFGREKETDDIINALDQSDGVIVVTGPSGAGKSSLLEAGIRPALEHRGDLLFHRATPAELSVDRLSKWCAKRLGCNENILSSIDDTNAKLTNSTLWVFDQAEELFVNTESDTCERWFGFLYELASRLSHLHIIFCLRHEYVWRLNELECFSGQTHQEVKVFARFTPSQWRDIIEKQAQYSGLIFEDGLADLIIDEAMRKGDNLPLVELLLTQLYEHSDKLVLRHRDYQALNGLSGIIDFHAEQTISTLPAEIILNGLNRSLASLIILSNDCNQELPILQWVGINDDSPDNVKHIIEALHDARLIIKHPEIPRHFRLVHDVIVRDWRRVDEWLNEYRPFLKWLTSINPHFKLWQSKSPDTQKKWLLPKGQLLRDSTQWLKTERYAIPHDVVEFIKQSQFSCARARLYSGSVFACIVCLFVSVVYLYFSYEDERELTAQRDLAEQEILRQKEVLKSQSSTIESEIKERKKVNRESQEIREAVLGLKKSDRGKLLGYSGLLDRLVIEKIKKENYDAALLLALNLSTNDYDSEKKILAQAKDELYVSTLLQKNLVSFYKAKTITDATASSDRKLVAVSSADKTTVIWSNETGKNLRTIKHQMEPKLVEFGPNQKSLTTYEKVTSKGFKAPYNVSIWSLERANKDPAKIKHRGLSEIKYSPDGKRLLLVGSTTALYSSDTGKILGSGKILGYRYIADFLRNGKYTMLHKDNWLNFYKTANMEGAGAITFGRNEYVIEAELSSSGEFIAVSIAGGVIALRSTLNSQLRLNIPNAYTARIIKFISLKQQLITVDQEKKIKLWRLDVMSEVERELEVKKFPSHFELMNDSKHFVVVVNNKMSLYKMSDFKMIKEWKLDNTKNFVSVH